MIRRRARALWIVGAWIGWGGSASAQPAAPGGLRVPDPVVATVGERTISAAEFGFRYSFTPWPQRYRHGLVADRKAQFLDGLIAEKLLAEAAERTDVRLDSLSLAYLDHLHGLLLRDALYRERIARGLVVPDTIRARADRLAATDLLLDAVAVPTALLTDARALLATGLPLDAVPARLPGASTDTVRYRWGQLEPSQEAALYALRPGEVSRPLSLNGRAVVVRLRDVALVPVESRPKPAEIDRVLTARVQSSRADALIESLLGVLAYQSDAAALRPLIDVLATRLGSLGTRPLTLGEADVASLRTELRARGARLDHLVARAGRTALTLDDAVTALAFGHATFGDPTMLWRSVDEAVKRAVRDALLRDEAVRLGYGERPEVRDEWNRWRDAALARAMRQSLVAPLPVAPVAAAPSAVQLRELLLSDLASVESVLRALDGGADLAELARVRSLAPTAVGGGLTTFLDPSTRGAVGQAAATLTPGDLYGPVRDERGRGYWLIRLEARRPATAASAHPADAALLARSMAAADRIARLDSAIVGLARRTPIRIDSTLLAAVRVDTGDAVAERTYGFGGQTPAVPPLSPTAWRALLSPDPLP